MAAAPALLYQAWTERFDLWFAALGTLRMRGELDEPYFFGTRFDGLCHPHYGRFLALEPDRSVEVTWKTDAGGTQGAETVVRVELEPAGAGTRLRLTHAGVANDESARQHAAAWPVVLAHLDERLSGQE